MTTKHFASSWLQSLTTKLEALTEWTWAADRRGACAVHRNLFREFFSFQFQKTLALVDEAKKTEFLGVVERNLYKFEPNAQQFPLLCLCALLQHGKDSPKTQEKIGAWVSFLIERLRRPSVPTGGAPQQAIADVIEECLSAPFQKFVPVMEDSVRNRLMDGLGERLAELQEDTQRRILDGMPALPARIDEVIGGCTKELNAWLAAAPRYPATPLALADALSKMEHPLVRFFTTLKDPSRKEAFLTAGALALQGLRTRFRWMCAVEPDLESLGSELQRKLFTVEGGQGPVMELWLSGRLKRYNAEVATRTASLIGGDYIKCESLKAKLQGRFPEGGGSATDEDSGWLSLDGPTSLADALLEWLGDNSPGFFCPQHTLARETITNVLLRFSSLFEVDQQRMRARVRVAGSAPQPQPAMQPPAMQPPAMLPPLAAAGPIAAAAANAQASAACALAGRPPMLALPAPGASQIPPPPPAVPPPPLRAITPGTGMAVDTALQAALAHLRAPGPPPQSEPDNLVDFLLNEALADVTPEVRMQITKLSHGLYRMGTKEVTLHTTNGRLYVYRIGATVRHVPIQTLLVEEGLAPAPAAPAPAAAPAAPAPAASSPAGASSPAAVDGQAVARVAQQSVASAGASASTAAAGGTLSRTQDAQALISKRVAAATRAMDVSKQIVRRAVNFDDERVLRKLLSKGLKHDKRWAQSYQEYCTGRGVTDTDHKAQNKEFVASFIERNLANYINDEWVKKIIHPPTEAQGEKKEKKEKKKEKKKKDRKRKASESSSSDAPATSTALALLPAGEPDPPSGGGPPAPAPGSADAGLAGDAHGAASIPAGLRAPPMGMPTMAPPHGPPGMPMYGMPYGMPGMMGMPGGMMPTMGMFGGDVGMGFPSPGVGAPEERARKKAKKEKKEKKK